MSKGRPPVLTREQIEKNLVKRKKTQYVKDKNRIVLREVLEIIMSIKLDSGLTVAEMVGSALIDECTRGNVLAIKTLSSIMYPNNKTQVELTIPTFIDDITDEKQIEVVDNVIDVEVKQ